MKTRNLRRLSPALVLVLIHAAVAAGAAVPCQDADPKHALSGLQPFMTAEMENAKLPGMAMAIVQNKKLLCAEGFGLRDVGAIVAPEKSIVTSVRVARAAQPAPRSSDLPVVLLFHQQMPSIGSLCLVAREDGHFQDRKPCSGLRVVWVVGCNMCRQVRGIIPDAKQNS